MLKYGLFVAVIVCVVDQWSKFAVFDFLYQLPPPPVYVVTSFFNLVVVYNSGVSFGMFGDLAYGPYILTGVAVAIVGFLLYWLYTTRDALLVWSLGLIIGGAVGNIIDRVRIGAVADFLDFHVAGYHWPAFNVADAAIFIGAVLLCIDMFRGEAKRHASS